MKTEIPQIQEIEKLTDDQLLDLWSYFWNKIFNKIDGGKRAANTSLA